MPKPIQKKEEQQEKNSYTAKDIDVLEGLEPVRKRPGMYIGSTGPDVLHHLVYECVDNSIDEALAGYAKKIEIHLWANNQVSVEDDGRGIPVDIHPKTKKSAGLHGVGVSVVNALSKYLRAEVYRDGYIYYQEYSQGKPITPLKKNGKTSKTGTKIIFEPDPEIFPEIKFDWKRIVDHLRYQAFLTPGVTMRVVDHQAENKIFPYIFHFENGISTF